MRSAFLRDAEWYKDETGWSEVLEQVKWIERSNPTGGRTLASRIDYLRRQTFDQALRGALIRKPSATIYVLRVQAGPFAYRLPFFEPLCRGGELIVFTECVKRGRDGPGGVRGADRAGGRAAPRLDRTKLREEEGGGR
jgi:hypothetical protein